METRLLRPISTQEKFPRTENFPTISLSFFFCVGVMYSGEYDVCDVFLSVYPHRASLKNMPDHSITYSNRPDRVVQLAEHWTSIPTVARHIFQACPVWIYTQSNIANKISLSKL